MKKNYFTNVNINNIIEAEDVVAKESEKIEKSKKGLKISAIATISWAVMALAWALALNIESNTISDIVFFTFGVPSFLVAFIGTIAAYIKSGALLETLKIIGKIGLVGWFIVPFPFDLITGFAVMAYTAFAFFVCPVAILGLVHLIRRKRIKKANEYLNHYAQVEERIAATPENQPIYETEIYQEVV